MLRQTCVIRGWRAQSELWRARPMLTGRARYEKSLGVREVTLRLTKETRYRTELRSFKNKALIRKNIDAAAVEHGTGWAHIKNDLARQNIALLPTAQRMLAQYEPLAFKSLLELCSSAIPPPPSTVEENPVIPPGVYNVAANASLEQKGTMPTAVAEEELKAMVERMLIKPSPALKAVCPKGDGSDVDRWMDAWKDFEKVDESKRIVASGL